MRITAVTLERGACFGVCPVYVVTLRRRGWSIWHGKFFTPRIGEFHGQVDEYDFDRIAAFVLRCGFFEWKAEYAPEVQITDVPGYVLQVTRGSVTKAVSQYATGEPPDFWVLAALVDHVANQITWIADK